MASPNDIESKIDTIISILPDAVSSRTIVYELTSSAGIYYLPEDVTFKTIESLIENDILPILQTGSLYYMYVGTTPNPQGEGARVHSWTCTLPNVYPNTIIISCLYQKLDDENNNALLPYSKTIS